MPTALLKILFRSLLAAVMLAGVAACSATPQPVARQRAAGQRVIPCDMLQGRPDCQNGYMPYP